MESFMQAAKAQNWVVEPQGEKIFSSPPPSFDTA
jgi:hypothetical protein